MTIEKETWKGFATGLIVGVLLVQLHILEFVLGFLYGLLR